MISISTFDFFLLCLATFRLTRLIVFDSITTFLRRPFHEIVEEMNADGQVETYLNIKGTGLKFWIGELLSCYWCVGIWAAIFLVVSYTFYFPFIMPVILILAIAGVASLIEMVVSKFV